MPARKSTRAPRAQSWCTEPSTLRAALDRLSDALALVETAEQAMDAAGASGAPFATLRRGIADLRLVHQGLDLAILGIERGAA